ncbi:hypothetical protein LEP1GSC016_2637 [Leptospira borgpetersenii serovar Hardjo-bovis str. Sponselee]|nr:hypothetical protein LEP1GSC016_2637 [Leptospira borgpetersenii serovar Hardjo-bovis str. Sponselee]
MGFLEKIPLFTKLGMIQGFILSKLFLREFVPGDSKTTSSYVRAIQLSPIRASLLSWIFFVRVVGKIYSASQIPSNPNRSETALAFSSAP